MVVWDEVGKLTQAGKHDEAGLLLEAALPDGAITVMIPAAAALAGVMTFNRDAGSSPQAFL